MAYKILLPTDFSDSSLNAIDFAIAHYGLVDVEYHIINIEDEYRTGATLMVDISHILKDNSIGELKKIESKLIVKYPGIYVNTIFRFGVFNYTLKKASNEYHIDLIVMATNGASGFRKSLIGSTTANLIDDAPVDLFIIPSDSNPDKLTNIRLAVEHSENDVHIFNKNVEALVNKTKATVSAFTLLNGEQNDFGVFVNNHEVELIKESVLGIDVIDGILNFIELHATDLLVLKHKKHSFFDKLINRSVSRELSMLVELPVLVLKKEE